MEKKTNIEKNKGEEKKRINLRNNFVVIGVAIILVVAIVILWGIYGHHYTWIPLESTFEAGL